jgi:hypothetical protein
LDYKVKALTQTTGADSTAPVILLSLGGGAPINALFVLMPVSV